MADEATVTVSLRVNKGNVKHNPSSRGFKGDVTNARGPSPGFLLIGTAGENITFTDITTPAYAQITNLDDTNFVEYGIWDGATFHELGEILPGESYVLRFSRNMTGFRMKADTAEVPVEISTFDN